MHPIRKKKLIYIVLVIVGLSLTTGLILYALRNNISLFYTPTQVAKGVTKPNQLFRLGGMVKKGSVEHQKGLQVQFIVTDFHHEITVQYQGLLPDLFREGQGIVAQGKLNASGRMVAQEVLAKHDENYMPDKSYSYK